MSANRELELFTKPTCPYCIKVMSFMEENGITVPLRDIEADEEAAKTLISVGGKRQVPCLFIDGQPLYESDNIIAWLRANEL